MLGVAGPTAELGMTILHCFATVLVLAARFCGQTILLFSLWLKCLLLLWRAMNAFTAVGDAYSFWLSIGMLSGAWTGQLLSGASAGLPALQLVIRQSL